MLTLVQLFQPANTTEIQGKYHCSVGLQFDWILPNKKMGCYLVKLPSPKLLITICISDPLSYIKYFSLPKRSEENAIMWTGLNKLTIFDRCLFIGNFRCEGEAKAAVGGPINSINTNNNPNPRNNAKKPGFKIVWQSFIQIINLDNFEIWIKCQCATWNKDSSKTLR